MKNELADTIETIANTLTDQDISIAMLIQLLGGFAEKHAGSGYYFTPRDDRFETVWVGITDDQAEERPTDIEITLNARSKLTIANLDRVLGPHRFVPFNPDGREHRVSYRFRRPNKQYTAAIYAVTDDEPESDTRVKRVSIRRDSR